MSTLGVAGLAAMIAIADRRVIALLVALVGFLVSSWHQDPKQRASLFAVLARTLPKIAVSPTAMLSSRKSLRRVRLSHRKATLGDGGPDE